MLVKGARFRVGENDAFYLFTDEAGMHQWQHLFVRLLLCLNTQLNQPPGKPAKKSFCLSSLLSSELASSFTTLLKVILIMLIYPSRATPRKMTPTIQCRSSCQVVEKHLNFLFYLILFAYKSEYLWIRRWTGNSFFFEAHSSCLGLCKCISIILCE